MRYLVIDTETGGLDPKRNPLLEIGAKLFLEDGTFDIGFQKGVMWTSKDRVIQVAAMSVNQRNLKDGSQPYDVARDFVQFIAAAHHRDKDLYLMGHNLPFDIDFVEEFINSQGFSGWTQGFHNRKIDTAVIATFLQKTGILPPEMKISLGTLYKRFFGSDISNAHTAHGDVDATFAVYREMLRLTRERVSWDSTQAIEVKK